MDGRIQPIKGSLFVKTKHIAIFEGDSVQLRYEDLENSNVCKWFKDGEEILPSNKTSVKNDGHSYQLNIHDAEKCDKGQYTCGDYKREMIFYLYVKDYFTVDLLTDRRDWYMEGDTVTISCQLVTENNSLQWFKDGNSITNSDRFEIMRDGKLHTLFIRAVKLEDRGDYSVLVKNCRRQTIVHVEGYFTVDLTTDRHDCYVEGDSVKIQCELVRENSSLQWFKDGNLITNSNRFTIQVDGKQHTLSIKAVKLEDRGEYSVLVKNCRQQTIVNVEDTKNASDNYHRLTEFLTTVVPDVMRKYLNIKILKGKSFETYLNTNKHDIYHAFKLMMCCQCKSDTVQQCKSDPVQQCKLSGTQFYSLYVSNEQIGRCKQYRGQKQQCICMISDKQNIEITILDITLVCCIVRNSGEMLEMGASVWLDAIRETRNNVFHYADSTTLSSDYFKKYWEKLSGSVGGIANLINKEYYTNVKEKMRAILNKVFVRKDVFAQEELLREYYQSKLADYEIDRQEEIIPYLTLLDKFLNEGKSDEYKDSNHRQLLLQKIGALNTTVDRVLMSFTGNVGVTKIFESKEKESLSFLRDSRVVPVLFHMEVPEDWDTYKIIRAVEKLRLKAAEESNIRIKSCSIEDLNILVEILRKVMKNTNDLQREIKHLCKNILKEAEVDTTKDAQIDITMFVEENKDTINSEDQVDSSNRENQVDTSNTEDQVKDRCDLCSESSEYHCSTCNQSMCQHCSTKHQSIQGNSGHVIEQIGVEYTLTESHQITGTSIIDIKSLDGDLLVISDFASSRLIICNARGEEQKTIKLRDRPYRISVIGNNKIAVLLSSDSKVVIVDIKQKQIVKSISVESWCRGIMYNNEQLFVGCRDNTIKVFSLSGELTETISLGFEPWHICGRPDGGVYCADHNNVYCIDEDGKNIFTYYIYGPIGLTVDDEGYVLVASRGFNNVHRISPDGCHNTIVISKIPPASQYMYYICFNTTSKSVIIGNDNQILVYTQQ